MATYNDQCLCYMQVPEIKNSTSAMTASSERWEGWERVSNIWDAFKPGNLSTTPHQSQYKPEHSYRWSPHTYFFMFCSIIFRSFSFTGLSTLVNCDLGEDRVDPGVFEPWMLACNIWDPVGSQSVSNWAILYPLVTLMSMRSPLALPLCQSRSVE